jgi:serine/threonine protein phosphatase PrpC
MGGATTTVLRAQGVTDKGRVRASNEDCFAIDESLQLLVVADGLGGHNAGEVASRIVVDEVLEQVRAASNGDHYDWPFGFDHARTEMANVLRSAVQTANMRILEAAGSSEELAGMGTTVVAAVIRLGVLSIAHVGDSRAYVVAEGRLRLLTRDDSWMADVLANDPNADPVALKNHPMRNALTNVVGTQSRTEVHITEEPLQGGELIVLTTDGVHGALSDPHIEELLNSNQHLERAGLVLVETALDRGSRDNCTAVVAHYVP